MRAAPYGLAGISDGPINAASMYSTKLSRITLPSWTSVGAAALRPLDDRKILGSHLVKLEEVHVVACPCNAFLFKRHAAPYRANRAPE